jgi:hypothetical protein
MCQLWSPKSQNNLVLVDILMTLCVQFQIHMLVYDRVEDKCERIFKISTFKANFKCLPTVELPDKEIILRSRKKFYDDYGFIYDPNRNVARDIKKPEKIIKEFDQRNIISAEETKKRFELWEPHPGKRDPRTVVNIYDEKNESRSEMLARKRKESRALAEIKYVSMISKYFHVFI